VIFGSFWYSQIQFQEMQKKNEIERQKQVNTSKESSDKK
jgi:hypothetical protein